MNRRSFLQNMAVGTLVVGVPAASGVTKAVTNNNVVGPILLERICDREKSRMSAAEWKDTVAKSGYRGCGTRFRWYFGMTCICPTCGWTYLYTFNDFKNKVFFVNAQS